jgi:predicted DCC family thiol-disulfide oxidoreductase YuxK
MKYAAQFTILLLMMQISLAFLLSNQHPARKRFMTAGVDVATRARHNLYKDNVILYDGVCNFCNTWVDLLLRIDTAKKFRFAPLQSSVGQQLLLSIGKDANDISSVVLIKENGDFFVKSECVSQVVREMGPIAALASKTASGLLPERLRDSMYDAVAENRYNLMGRRDECRCSDPKYADRFLMD